MAKGKNTINIEFSDGDTLKDLQKKLKKAAGGFDSLATSQRGADRAAKGLTQQSSNQTKNFSKIQQGISGGLVPIYATLAAQVFAVTAAFQFLSNSVDYKNLIAGQESFGAVTGVAMRTYTMGVQAATEGQLRFAEAAQAVAIGTAAGLSRNQITEIGKAAKNTSLALGRDLTDSFNRLTRGITKAEPELLDELGIILRLDPALKAYADKIGKSKEQLNQFEKSQAIANEVLGQAESKFGKIAEIMDPSAFALQQFAVAFDNLLAKFQVGIGTVLLPLLKFLSDNVYALTAALGLFALPIVKTILPNFDAMGKAAQENVQIATDAVKNAQKDFDKLNFVDNKKTRDKSMTDINAMRAGKGQGKMSAMYNQMSQKQITAHKKMLAAKKGDYANYTRQERQIMFKHLKQQENALRVSEAKKRGEYAKTTSFFRLQQQRMVLFHKKAQVEMVKATKMFAGAMTKLMSFAGYLGILTMIGSIVMAGIEFFKKANEDQDKLTEKLQDHIKVQQSLNQELEKMNEIRAEGLVKGGLDTAVHFGNMIQSAGSVQAVRDMENFQKTQRKLFADDEKKLATATMKDIDLFERQTRINQRTGMQYKTNVKVGTRKGFADKDLDKNFLNTLDTIKNLQQGAVGPLKDSYKELYETLEKGEKPTKQQLDNLQKEESAYITLTERVKRYGEVSKTFQQSLTGMAGKGLPLQNQRRAVNDMIRSQQAVLTLTELGGGPQSVKDDPTTDVDERKEAEAKYAADLAYMTKLKNFRDDEEKGLKAIVEGEKNILTTRQENARTILDHADARTIAEKKAKIDATGLLAVQEKQARAVQDEMNAKAALEALKLKGYKKTSDFMNEKGVLDTVALDKYIEEGGIIEENVLDAEHAVKLAGDKVTTANKEVTVQEKLNKLAQINLDIQENNLKLKAAQLNQDTLALQQQIGNVGFNTMYGGTGFGQRAKKQQDVELKSFEIEKQRLAIETQRANLAKQGYDIKSTEYIAEMASINNNEKKLELLRKQTEASEYAATHLGELQMSFAKGIEDMFVAIATGSKSAKEAFKDLALFMLKKMAEMAAQQLAMKAIMAMGLPIPMARGGIIPMASGGVMRKYATGGIATEPTYLVGEGKHNEAVVPLPDGRSIPVDMKGGSGSTNNVSINVNVDGSSSNVADGERGKALGKMMEVAVMEVIQREKRPGGVLGR